MSFWLGIDCGGTFVKAGIYNAEGKELGGFRQNLTVISERPGWAERDLAELWSSCIAVIQGVLNKTKILASDIRGVGISAQGKGLFLLDKDQRPLGRGILSSDQRSIEIVKAWQAQGIPEQLYSLTRQTLWTGHPVSILRWIKLYDPERYTKIGSVLMSHDYLRFCLTGEVYCEESNISESNLYNMFKRGYDEDIANLLGIAEIFTALPPIVASSDIAGYITKQVAQQTGLLEGTPVVGGLFDVVSSALCAELDDETKLNVTLGTWSVVSGITSVVNTNDRLPFVYGRHAQEDKFIVHEASPTSAGNLEWFIKQWGNLDYHQINQLVGALPKAESSVLFIPFLYGSNAGLGMKGSFYGLQSLHQQAHLLQAIYEGVIFSLMTHLEKMLIRFPDTRVLRVTGGPAKSLVWMQILADLTGLTVEIPQVEETGCLGAALVAMVGLRVYSDCQSAQSAVKNQKVFVLPDKSAYDKYQQKYQRYNLLIQSLRDFNDQINTLI